MLKIPVFGPSLIHQFRLLGSQQYPQSGDLLTSFSTWGRENSLAEINLESTEGDKGLRHFGGSKIDNHLQLCGQAHYRATKKNLESRTQLDEPVECSSGDDPLLLYKILHLLFSLLVRILCALRLESRKTYRHGLDGGAFGICFFGRGDVSPTHSEFCRFASGSQTKHQVSSHVIILLKKNLSASVTAIMSWRDVIRSSLSSGVKECETKRAHNFLFPKSYFRIGRTGVLGKFKDSAIVLDAIGRSLLPKSATAAMFTSVRVDFERPPLSSSSTSSLPSWNPEYHLKTFDRFRASFP